MDRLNRGRRAEALFASSSSAIVLLNEDGRVEDINDRFVEVFGYELDDIKGEDIDNILARDDTASSRGIRLTERALAGEKIETEGICYTKNDRPAEFIIKSVPIWADDRVVGVYGIYDDITELKRTRKELELTRFSVDKADLMVFRISPAGYIYYVNEAACDLLNYSREELLGLKISDINCEIEEDARAEFWHELKKQGSIRNESVLCTKTGDEIPVEMTRQHLQFDDSEYEIAFASDISRRKKFEKKCRIREEQYRKVFNKSPVGMVLCDEEGGILKVNDTMIDISGYSREELEGNSILDTLVPQGSEEKAREDIAAILSGEDLRKTESSRKKNGEIYHVHLIETQITLPDGREGFLSMQLDITEQKKKERQLEYAGYHDELTDLYNRTFMEEEMKRLDTERQLPLAVIMADVNGLKIINDTYGHEKGDELLIKVAQILQETTRKEDIVARWSGDEFVIILPRTGEEQAAGIKERIKNYCISCEFDGIPVSLGMGIAVKKIQTQSIYDVINAADADMYEDKLTETRSARNRLVENMLCTLGAKSHETEEHAKRMTELAVELGRALDLTSRELNQLSLLASLHDIGKITISRDILTKPEELTEEEWEIIKKHTERGYRIAAATEDFAPVADYILHHHERWDGEGYPSGLQGEEIPLLSRIISIVDAYDVMRNGRPYQQALDREEAREELENCAGSQFDPDLVRIFLEEVLTKQNR